MEPEMKFTNSRRMVMFALAMINVTTFAVAYVDPTGFKDIALNSILIQGGLVGGWTGVSNWAQLRDRQRVA